jgi:hypothetical protein
LHGIAGNGDTSTARGIGGTAKGDPETSERAPEAGSIWNIEMSSLCGFKMKINLANPSLATRPPSRRSLKGEPGTRLRAPVWLALLNPETREEVGAGEER